MHGLQEEPAAQGSGLREESCKPRALPEAPESSFAGGKVRKWQWFSEAIYQKSFVRNHLSETIYQKPFIRNHLSEIILAQVCVFSMQMGSV